MKCTCKDQNNNNSFKRKENVKLLLEENRINSPTVLSLMHTHIHKTTSDRVDSTQFKMALPSNDQATATLKQSLDEG